MAKPGDLDPVATTAQTQVPECKVEEARRLAALAYWYDTRGQTREWEVEEPEETPAGRD